MRCFENRAHPLNRPLTINASDETGRMGSRDAEAVRIAITTKGKKEIGCYLTLDEAKRLQAELTEALRTVENRPCSVCGDRNSGHTCCPPRKE